MERRLSIGLARLRVQSW